MTHPPAEKPGVTGLPALLYAGFGPAATPTWYFIGTAKQKPRIQVRRAIKEVMNDIGGDKQVDLNV